MSSNQESGRPQDAGDPLAAVAEAAGARLRAEAEEDAAATDTASESFMAATMSAMGAGFSLREITAAETRGQNDVRTALRRDTLRKVERAAGHARNAEAEYHAAVGRAVRLGLSTREVASAAGVTHGTIRAISQRVAPHGPGALAGTTPPEGEADKPSP